MKKILITEKIDPTVVKKLSTIGKVAYHPEAPRTEIKKLLKDAECLIVRSKVRVDKELIKCGKKLKIIAMYGIGVDHIDLDEATKKGILVINTPTASVSSVAELVLAYCLILARKLRTADQKIRKNYWDRKKLVGFELKNKTLGIIGLGRIGAEVASRANAFQMKILGHDPYVSPQRAKEYGAQLVEVEKLLKNSDFVTIHVPLLKNTRKMLSKKQFSLMKKTAFFINTARGGVVDEDALYQALKNKKIAGAALDVFEQENKKLPFFELQNVFLTPHIGSNTRDAQKEIGTQLFEDLKRALEGTIVSNAVNVPSIKTHELKKIDSEILVAQNTGALLSDAEYDTIVLVYSKELQGAEKDLIGRAVLKTLLGKHQEPQAVNLVNAKQFAKQRGIKIVETTTDEEKKLLTIVLKKNAKKTAEAATNLSTITKINQFETNLAPKGNLLFAQIIDKPGVIGKICTVLGEEKINIAKMDVSRNKAKKTQLVAIKTDQTPGPEVIKRLEKIPETKKINKHVF